MTSVIIWSPGGEGKSFYRDDFAKFFKCWPIIEEWSPDKKIVSGALHLSNAPMEYPPKWVTQLTFAEAALRSGLEPLRPAESLQE